MRALGPAAGEVSLLKTRTRQRTLGETTGTTRMLGNHVDGGPCGNADTTEEGIEDGPTRAERTEEVGPSGYPFWLSSAAWTGRRAPQRCCAVFLRLAIECEPDSWGPAMAASAIHLNRVARRHGCHAHSIRFLSGLIVGSPAVLQSPRVTPCRQCHRKSYKTCIWHAYICLCLLGREGAWSRLVFTTC